MTPVSIPTVSKDIILFLCGDVMTGRGIDQVLPQHVEPRLYEAYVKDARDYVRLAERKNGIIQAPVPHTYIWGDALDAWQQVHPDLKLINLETGITNHSVPWPDKGIHYRMHPGNVALLKTAGIDFCSLANNHIMDWEREGLLETMKSLKEAGIAFTGAGENLNEAGQPAILPVKNNRVIIFAYGHGSSGIPYSWAAAPGLPGINLLPDLSLETVHNIAEQVQSVKRAGDVVVFSVHWGSNWGYEIPPHHREFAHALVDEAGVDMVYGHSSHHPRTIEVYKEKLILYGAGDLINDYEGISGHSEYRSDLSLMYFPTISATTGKLLSMQMVPMQTKKFRLYFASAADASWLFRVLNWEGSKVGTSFAMNADVIWALHW